MDEIRYLISDASKKVDVETHVLRYWEGELGISVPRNGMGHRYYTEFHIRLFCQVKKLKDKGYQLKAIKHVLEQVMEKNSDVIDEANLLDADISQSLQENQLSPFFGKIAASTNLVSAEAVIPCASQSSKEESLEKEISLSDGIARLSDYSCLEPEESGSEKLIDSGKLISHQGNNQEENEIERFDSKAWIFINKKEKSFEYHTDEDSSLAEYKYVKPNQKTDEDKQHTKEQSHTVKTAAVEHIAGKGKIQEEQRIKEKDGQAEMKNKRKDRKKPSAWERRNGIGGVNHLSPSQLRNQVNVNGRNDWEDEDYLLEEIVERMPERVQDRIKGAMYGSRTMEEFERNLAGRRESEQEEYMEDSANHLLGENAERMDSVGEENIDGEDKDVNAEKQINTETESQKAVPSELSAVSEKEQGAEVLTLSQDEKMMKFQEIMNHIIGKALEVNNEKLSQEISSLVNQKIIDELEDLMRIRDEREEERFRQIDEIIRSCQRDSQGKTEAAAAKMPFFKRKWLGRGNKHLQSF